MHKNYFLVHVAYFCKFMYTMKMLKEMETLLMVYR